MELPTLTADHKYVMQDGREIPSVSSVLQAAGLCDLSYVTQYALDRGSALHDAILYHHEGVLDEDSLDPAVKPNFEQYKKFLAVSGAKVLKAEQIVYDDFQNYAGRYDLIINLNRSVWLIDAKTNTKPRHILAQLGAYHLALLKMRETPRVTKLGCLVLSENNFRLHEYEVIEAQMEWMRALMKAREKK
jgi:hypothetical protein